VQTLSGGLRQVASDHLGWLPTDFEFHGVEIWSGIKCWEGKSPSELLAAYEAAIALLDTCDITIAHSSIQKERLHQRYGGAADKNAYLLALQFLLEKIDLNLGSANKVLVADETKEQQLRAVKMVADMQQWGGGEVPGRQLRTIIDSLHFVRSNASPGVQMADLVAYLLQRQRRPRANQHPDALAALDRMGSVILNHTRTWRQPWPSAH